MRKLKKFESFNVSENDLIVGQTYTIEHPLYDDFDEGLEADVDEVKIIKRLRDGYLVSDKNEDYEISLTYLKTCKITK